MERVASKNGLNRKNPAQCGRYVIVDNRVSIDPLSKILLSIEEKLFKAEIGAGGVITGTDRIANRGIPPRIGVMNYNKTSQVFVMAEGESVVILGVSRNRREYNEAVAEILKFVKSKSY